MAKSKWPNRNVAARTFRQLRRFLHNINADKVFGTHNLRGIANIKFTVEEMKKVQPNADYDHLTVVGHSAGADISMYFAKMYPNHIKEVVTLDNLRVPFMTDGRFKIPVSYTHLRAHETVLDIVCRL